MTNRTNNALAAGSAAGAVTAALSPGTIGVVCGTFYAAIPVVGQVLAAGTFAACAAAALTEDTPQDSSAEWPERVELEQLHLECIFLDELGKSKAHLEPRMTELQEILIAKAHQTMRYAQ
jgi:hypothetical protein